MCNAYGRSISTIQQSHLCDWQNQQTYTLYIQISRTGVLSKEYEPTWLLKTQNQVPSESLVLKRSYGLYIDSIKDNPCYLMLRLVLVAHVSPLSNCHAMEDDNTKVCIKKQYPVCCY